MTSFDGFSWQLERPLQAREDLQALLDLCSAGKLHAVHPLHAYSISEAKDAFRLMQKGISAGKIVLEITSNSQILISSIHVDQTGQATNYCFKILLSTRPSSRIEEDSTYLNAGGFGGLGCSIARWLVDRGAKNLILLSRSGAKSAVALKFLDELKERGTKVATPPCDVTDLSSLHGLLQQSAMDMLPIKGCI